jgi:hypothetical protein
MALTGTLHADFVEFTTACQKAKADLMALEAQAGTVGPAIDRMVSTSASGLAAIQAPAEQFGTTLVSAADVAQQSFVKLPGMFAELRGGLNDVAAGAGLTAESLGLFSAAGLIAGTAMGSWKLTRAAMEFLGLDDAVAKAWTHLLGLNDAIAAGAAAKLDVLARASLTAGRDITDMAEAMRINAKAVDDWNAALLRARGPEESRLQIERWRQEIDKVVSAGVIKSLTLDIESHNFSQKDLADRYQISTGALGFFIAGLKDADANTKAYQASIVALGKEEAARAAQAKALLAEVTAVEQGAHALSMDWTKELNAAKAKANFAGMQDTLKSLNDTAALEREAATLRMGLYATDTEMRIQKAHEWFDDEVAKLKASDANYQAHYNALLDVESLRIAKIYQVADAAEASAKREVAAINGVTLSYWAAIDAAARLAGVTVVGNRPGEGPGINGAPPPSTFSLGPGITLGPGAAGIRAGGASTGGSVVNHIYVNGTAEDVARTIADKVLRTVMQTRKLGSA